MRVRGWIVACLLAQALGCAQLGVVSDGTSVAHGATNGGFLLDGVPLPAAGPGFWTPPRWRERGHRFGTQELVDLVIGTGARLRDRKVKMRLGVGDLSPVGGGRSPQHRSHQTGRDLDLLLFAEDAQGRPIEIADMRRYGEDGWTIDDAQYGGVRARFDVARNWEVVRALVTAPEAEVQRLFLFEPLTQQVLDHARATDEPEALVEAARLLLAQPGDSAPHDDHLHVRIFCPVNDLRYGCVDRNDGSDRPKPRG